MARLKKNNRIFKKISRYFKIFPKNKCKFASLKKKIYFKFVELFLKL